MDRISAIRNVEDALADFEDGVVVTAEDRPEARDRVEEIIDAESLEFELEELG